MSGEKRDRAFEQAHGGIVARDGDMVTLDSGAKAWLNGEKWARDAADAAMVHPGVLKEMNK